MELFWALVGAPTVDVCPFVTVLNETFPAELIAEQLRDSQPYLVTKWPEDFLAGSLLLTVDTNLEEEGCHQRGTCTRSSSQTVVGVHRGTYGRVIPGPLFAVLYEEEEEDLFHERFVDFAGLVYCHVLTPDGDVYDVIASNVCCWRLLGRLQTRCGAFSVASQSMVITMKTNC